MDFKVDENLPAEIAQLLLEAGHSVSTVLAEGLGGATDERVFAAARNEARVLVTLDAGFGDIRTYPPSQTSGIIVLRLRKLDKDSIVEVFRRVVPRLELEPLRERLWIVEESRVRVRS